MALMVKLKLPTRVEPDVLPPPSHRGIHTNKIEFLKRQLLDKLPSKPFALDFMQPVDTEVLQVPAYYMIIRHPMDVGTIIKRVHNEYYNCVAQLIDDFRLVIGNCYKFNRPGEVVYRKGKQLEKFFMKVLAQLPSGAEFRSLRDPRAPRSPTPTQQTIRMRQRQFREDLRQLQQLCNERLTEAVRDFFKEKWLALGKRISKHAYKTLEDFHVQLDDVLLQSQAQAKRVYENAFCVPLDSVCQQHRGSQLSELLYEVKRMDGSLRSPYNAQARWEFGLMDGIDFLIERLIKKLDKCRQLNGESWQRRKMLESAKSSDLRKLNSLTHQLDASDDDLQPHFNEIERHAMQQQFVMMPVHVKDEIMDIVARNEDKSCENFDLQWYDFLHFHDETLLAIKRAMLPHSKLNLRHMKPAEKADLQRTLENRLKSINQTLNGHRRKYTHRIRMRDKLPARKRARYDAVAVRSSHLQQQQQQQQRRRNSQGGSGDDSSDSSDSSSSSSDSTDRSDPSNESS